MPDVQMQIVKLVRENGFEEVNQADVVKLLESLGEDLTNEDLIQLERKKAREQEKDAEKLTPLHSSL